MWIRIWHDITETCKGSPIWQNWLQITVHHSGFRCVNNPRSLGRQRQKHDSLVQPQGRHLLINGAGQSTRQEERQAAGIRMSPRHRCAVGEATKRGRSITPPRLGGLCSPACQCSGTAPGSSGHPSPDPHSPEEQLQQFCDGRRAAICRRGGAVAVSIFRKWDSSRPERLFFFHYATPSSLCYRSTNINENFLSLWLIGKNSTHRLRHHWTLAAPNSLYRPRGCRMVRKDENLPQSHQGSEAAGLCPFWPCETEPMLASLRACWPRLGSEFVWRRGRQPALFLPKKSVYVLVFFIANL
jgi:hypothetical protein